MINDNGLGYKCLHAHVSSGMEKLIYFSMSSGGKNGRLFLHEFRRERPQEEVYLHSRQFSQGELFYSSSWGNFSMSSARKASVEWVKSDPNHRWPCAPNGTRLDILRDRHFAIYHDTKRPSFFWGPNRDWGHVQAQEVTNNMCWIRKKLSRQTLRKLPGGTKIPSLRSSEESEIFYAHVYPAVLFCPSSPAALLLQAPSVARKRMQNPSFWQSITPSRD
jgi:hypothetical protein